MTMDEFVKHYGTKTVALLMSKFINLAPDFPECNELAAELGTAMSDLQSALQDFQETASIPH